MNHSRIRNISLVVYLLLVNVQATTAAYKQIRLSISLENQWKSDSDFKRFYGKSIAGIMFEAGFRAKQWLTLGGTVGYFSRTGETLVLKEEIQFRQIPVLFYARGSVGHRLRAIAGLMAGWLLFREKSYIGTINGHPFGWGGEIGCEFDLTKNIFVASVLRFLYFRFQDPEFMQKQQLGGSDMRISIGINL